YAAPLARVSHSATAFLPASREVTPFRASSTTRTNSGATFFPPETSRSPSERIAGQFFTFESHSSFSPPTGLTLSFRSGGTSLPAFLSLSVSVSIAGQSRDGADTSRQSRSNGSSVNGGIFANGLSSDSRSTFAHAPTSGSLHFTSAGHSFDVAGFDMSCGVNSKFSLSVFSTYSTY